MPIYRLEFGELPDLPGRFRNAIKTAIGPNGVSPQHVMWRIERTIRHETAPLDRRSMLSVCCDLIVRGHGIEELIFGLDVESDTEPKKIDGKKLRLPLGRAVIVGYWKEHWRTGVLNYSHNPAQLFNYDWENQVARDRLKLMINQGIKIHAEKPRIAGGNPLGPENVRISQ